MLLSDYRDWVKHDQKHYDFAHAAILHAYAEAHKCGLWAVQHSDCCVFHDTESFGEVRRAVHGIAKATWKKACDHPHHHGLGIFI